MLRASKWLVAIVGFIALSASVATCSDISVTSRESTEMSTLRPCPSTPNCVSSQAADSRHRMEPLPYTGPREAAQARLRRILEGLPRCTITKDDPGYIAASFHSRLFGFVDEAQFALAEPEKLIQFRSGADTGYWDFGVNRSRMKRIIETFKRESAQP